MDLNRKEKKTRSEYIGSVVGVIGEGRGEEGNGGEKIYSTIKQF